MIEIQISGENFSSASTLIDASDTNEDIHVILSSNERLKVIPSLWTSIFTNVRLRCLSLINVQLYGNDAEILAKYLSEAKNLIKLTFDSVFLHVYSFDRILNEGLEKNRSIEHLVLTNLDNIDAATVASLIKHNNTIKYLALTNDDITSDAAAIIADALRTNSTLVTLDLSGNRIDDNVSRELLSLLEEPNHSLTNIILINNTAKPIINHNNIDDNTPIIDGTSKTMEIQDTHEDEPILSDNKIEIHKKNSKPERKFQFLSTVLVTFLFFLWGIPNRLNDVLIRQFSKSFVLSRFEAGLVQSAFYMGYFVWALPAAYVLRRWGYKVGIILGLILFGTGSLLFWPAAYIGQYLPFLISLFIIATGLSFLETAANPFIAHAAGSKHSAEKRLNIAQAFNPLGAITGVLIGTVFIFSDVEMSDERIEQIRANHSHANYLRAETLRVVRPYAVVGGVAFLWALLIGLAPFPDHNKTKKNHANRETDGSHTLCRALFLCAVIAQFAYVGAQVGTWSYFMQYAQDYVHVDDKIGGYLLTGTSAAFAVGRFVFALLMHCGLSPSILLATSALLNVILIVIVVTLPNEFGLTALFCTSFFMSLMFPTIFALGIKGMNGHTTKLASCILIMAIVGGAVFTPLMGLIAVQTKRLALAYTLPGGAYIVIALYALLANVLTVNEPKKS